MKIMMMTLLTMLSIFSNAQSNNVSADGSVPQTPFEYTRKIYRELEEIKKIAHKNYFTQIDNYRTKLEKYIQHKKRVCEGEFSFIILGDLPKAKEKSKKATNKLSKEEQGLCFRELKALQITFINNMFVARKAYLNYLHSLRIKELQTSRDLAVKELNDQFNKK